MPYALTLLAKAFDHSGDHAGTNELYREASDRGDPWRWEYWLQNTNDW